MAQRYAVQEGIILRRLELPSGDIVVTLLSEESKWRAVARKGKLVGGNLGKLSLFHDVSVQHYTRPGDQSDLALITQVQLNGALPRLSDPAIYPYAHVLAELTDKLAVDVHLDGGFYRYFTGALRGVSQHPDPERVALVMSWRLLAQGGLTPRLTRCARCGERDLEGATTFDVAAGGLSCAACGSGFSAFAECKRRTHHAAPFGCCGGARAPLYRAPRTLVFAVALSELSRWRGAEPTLLTQNAGSCGLNGSLWSLVNGTVQTKLYE